MYPIYNIHDIVDTLLEIRKRVTPKENQDESVTEILDVDGTVIAKI